MEENMKHFWYIMHYSFKKGENATETHTKIVYGEGAVSDVCVKSGL